MFVKYPNQQRLVHFYEKNFHEKSNSEEPESLTPKKEHSLKTSKEPSSSSFDNFVALCCRSDETGMSLSSSFDSDLNSSGHNIPSEHDASEI